MTLAAIAAVLYDGWVFYSRWRDGRRAQDAQRAREAGAAEKSFELAGGGRLRILQFYASVATIHRGERTNLCYGVSGAKRVRVEPAVAELHPALSYCFSVAPRQDAEYTLIAEGASGNAVKQSLRVKVVAPAHLKM